MRNDCERVPLPSFKKSVGFVVFEWGLGKGDVRDWRDEGVVTRVGGGCGGSGGGVQEV